MINDMDRIAGMRKKGPNEMRCKIIILITAQNILMRTGKWEVAILKNSKSPTRDVMRISRWNNHGGPGPMIKIRAGMPMIAVSHLFRCIVWLDICARDALQSLPVGYLIPRGAESSFPFLIFFNGSKIGLFSEIRP